MKKSIKILIKKEDILKNRGRVGKGFAIRPMVQKDKKKEVSKMSCRNARY